MICLELILRCASLGIHHLISTAWQLWNIVHYLLDYILPALSLGVLILIVTRLLFRLRLFHLVIALSSRRYVVLGNSLLIVYSVVFPFVWLSFTSRGTYFFLLSSSLMLQDIRYLLTGSPIRKKPVSYYVGLFSPGLSKVAGCRQKSPPTSLVLADYSAWHFFVDGIFLNKISLDWSLTLTTQPSTSKLSDNPVSHKLMIPKIPPHDQKEFNSWRWRTLITWTWTLC